MKKLALILLAEVLASPAAANWRQVAKTPTDSFSVNDGEINKSGNARSGWILITPLYRGGQSNSSTMQWWEFRCDIHQYRVVSYMKYVGSSMIDIGEYSDKNFSNIAPETAAKTIELEVCQ